MEGSEGNSLFDGFGEYKDCGQDNICNEDGDDENDDYIIDPNNDNLDLGTEGNGIRDEGEIYYDWGIDETPDSLESFEDQQFINPILYDN